MANRKLPFGYHIQGGQIQIEEHEAEVVRLIFDRYAESPSYNRLTAVLNGQDVPYAPGKRWNKNMAARILRDGRYMGGAYPQIITPETFRRTQAARPDVTGTAERPEIKDIRILARCAVCHAPVQRERKDNWFCSNCAGNSAKIRDDNLIHCVEVLLNRLRESPDTARPSPVCNDESEVIRDAQARLTDELDKPEFDEGTAKAAALALAAARFDALGSADYEAMRIQYILARAEQADGLDVELLRQITAAVLIHPSGAVSLMLRNGQTLENPAG